MNPAKGYYSIIQYCPNPSRAEAANVGILLFCPDARRIDARMASGNERVRHFFQDDERASIEQVNSAKDAIVKRLQAEKDRFQVLEDLQKFIGTRANEIVITPPRPTKVVDFDAELTSLFDELVGGRAARRESASVPEIPELDSEFRQSRFGGRIRFNQNVEVPVVCRSMKIPYVYQNGALHLVKPVRFSESVPNAITSAMRLAVEGDLLQRHRNGDVERKFIVVPKHAEPDAVHTEQIHTLFGEYKVRCIRQDGIASFIEEVAAEAR